MADDDGDLNPHHIDGDDPNALVGPEQCVAEPADTFIKPGERDGGASETHYPADAMIDESFLVEELVTPMADDGLPDHSADTVSSGTHPFTIESMCCIEDDRSYVAIFGDELAERGWRWQSGAFTAPDARPPRVGLRQWDPPGHYGQSKHSFCAPERYDEEGRKNARERFDPDEVVKLYGQTVVRLSSAALLPVRPLRERCKYYARQHFANDDQPDPKDAGHNIIFRLCTHPARRSIGGAAMGLMNEGVYGCDLRDPHDPDTVRWLDDHDARKVRDRPDRTRLPLFDFPGDVVVEDEDEEEEPAFDGGAAARGQMGALQFEDEKLDSEDDAHLVAAANPTTHAMKAARSAAPNVDAAASAAVDSLPRHHITFDSVISREVSSPPHPDDPVRHDATLRLTDPEERRQLELVRGPTAPIEDCKVERLHPGGSPFGEATLLIRAPGEEAVLRTWSEKKLSCEVQIGRIVLQGMVCWLSTGPRFVFVVDLRAEHSAVWWPKFEQFDRVERARLHTPEASTAPETDGAPALEASGEAAARTAGILELPTNGWQAKTQAGEVIEAPTRIRKLACSFRRVERGSSPLGDGVFEIEAPKNGALIRSWVGLGCRLTHAASGHEFSGTVFYLVRRTTSKGSVLRHEFVLDLTEPDTAAAWAAVLAHPRSDKGGA